MPSMNVSLTSELMRTVQSKVESCLYNNASEVISDAIRQMDSNAELLNHLKLAHLKETLDEGVRQAKIGDAEPYGLKDLIADLDGRA